MKTLKLYASAILSIKLLVEDASMFVVDVNSRLGYKERYKFNSLGEANSKFREIIKDLCRL